MNKINLFKFVKNQEWDNFLKNIYKDTDLNIQDDNSNYLIQYIILYNNHIVLKKILEYDVYIDWLDTEGHSILYNPIKYGYTNIVKELLLYDDNNVGIFLTQIKDSHSKLPIHYALLFKNYEMYELLLDKTKISVHDINNNSLLHLVPKTKNIKFLTTLLNKIININVVNNNNETALHIACAYDLNTFVKELLNKNIDTNIRDNIYGFTAIFIALLNNNNDISFMILDNNMYDINIQDYNGNTIIHIAIMENNFEIINKCIENDTLDFNIVNVDGNTYLHLILEKIMSENIPITEYNIKQFLSKTILNIQNNVGETIWHYLIKLNIFEQHKDVLINKSNNIFINNNDNITPFSLVKSDMKDKLVDIVAQSYMNKLKTSTWNNDWENECINSTGNNIKKCMEKIKDNILKNNISVPIKKSNYCMNIEKPHFVSFTTFTGINFDVITSYIELMKNNTSLTTSITENFSSNIEVEKQYKKLNIVKELGIDYLNFEIFWIFQQMILPTNLDDIIKTFIDSDKIMLVIPLAIEINIGAHANVIIIDKRYKTIDRFEPNGKKEPNNFNYNSSMLDKMLKIYFEKYLQYEYLTPDETQQMIGFQSLETNEKNKKIGDPGGFCVGWCLWYVEQRIKYNINPKKIALKLIINIKSQNISFKKLIRMYVNNILKTRNNILEQLELDINDIRNNNITDEQKTNLTQLLKYELLNI